MSETDHRPFYPLFLDIRDRRVVIVGGGFVAERKVRGLLPYAPNLLVVSPKLTVSLEGFAEVGLLQWRRREFVDTDLDDAILVFCAVGDIVLDRRVHELAERRGIPLNVADGPSLCDFIVASIVRRGPFQLAVSTSGAVPGLAKQVREELEERYPESWETYVRFLGEVRDLAKVRYPGDRYLRAAIIERLLGLDLLTETESGKLPNPEDLLNTLVSTVTEDQRRREDGL